MIPSKCNSCKLNAYSVSKYLDKYVVPFDPIGLA